MSSKTYAAFSNPGVREMRWPWSRDRQEEAKQDDAERKFIEARIDLRNVLGELEEVLDRFEEHINDEGRR